MLRHEGGNEDDKGGLAYCDAYNRHARDTQTSHCLNLQHEYPCLLQTLTSAFLRWPFRSSSWQRLSGHTCFWHPGRTVLNGNGKLPWELRLAIQEGVLVNVDSEFDLQNIAAAAEAVGKPARILIRINPDVDPKAWSLPQLA